MLRSFKALKRLAAGRHLAEAGRPSSRAIHPIFQASRKFSQKRRSDRGYRFGFFG
jgi:hypothetical protein